MNQIDRRILARGVDLAAEGAFGELRRSDDVADDLKALLGRFADDGYLYLPQFFPVEEVKAARLEIAAALAAQGLLDQSHPVEDVVKNQAANLGFMANPVLAMDFMTSLAKRSAGMRRLLYSDKILRFFEGLFSDKVRHFDFTWVRTMGCGFGTEPHCDVVYMGRGSSRLCTVWTPFTEISYEIGGLMILEGSHRRDTLLRNYLGRDVDRYCENRPEAEKIKSGEIPWTWDGVLSRNPSTLRQHLGGRWLSAEFRLGDILVFGMKTVHASLDNQSPYFRISTDSRYQPASEPIDERWTGENPVGHGRGGKRPMIC